EKSLALSAAASAAEDYINNLRVGETLVLNQIADRLLNADSKILDVDKGWSLSYNLIVNTPLLLRDGQIIACRIHIVEDRSANQLGMEQAESPEASKLTVQFQSDTARAPALRGSTRTTSREASLLPARAAG